MPSITEVDNIHEKTADAGVTIGHDLKLSSGKSIKKADGTALLTEAGALDNVTLGSSAVFPAGTVLQVVSFTSSETDSTTADQSFEALGNPTLFEKAITVAVGNSVLVLYDLNIGTSADAVNCFIKLIRTSTDIKIGDASSGRTRLTTVVERHGRLAMQNVAGSFLDTSPATGVNTYKVYWTNSGGSVVSYLNKGSADSDNGYTGRGASTLTLLEIKA